MTPAVTRRRFLSIAAATGALSLAGLAAGGASDRGGRIVWRGRALGAEAEIRLAAEDETAARTAIARAVAEAERLEAIFSLYVPQSEIVRLNRDGRIESASLDLRRVIAASQRWGVLTGGGFDVTVQPIWDLFARHFSADGADVAGPADDAIAAACAKVDYRAIEIDGVSVAFLRPGMAMTLNGIAQGYITDRVADVLADAGFAHALIDMGEIAAHGPPPGEAGWQVGIEDPRARGRIIDRVVLGPRQAMATSSGFGTRFDPEGRHHHIFVPATGRSAHAVVSVTVLAGNAFVA
ncbi:MAG: FAD:protein FMN transferase, partial [Alphaproteobacteria bacterium]